MRIELIDTTETDLVYDSYGFWQNYDIYDKNNQMIFTGFKIIKGREDKVDKSKIIKEIEKHIESFGGIDKFPKLINLRDGLVELIMECHQSENEMWFIEWDDEFLAYANLNEMCDDVEKWNLESVIEIDYINRGNGDPAITVYGGVSEYINFINIK